MFWRLSLMGLFCLALCLGIFGYLPMAIAGSLALSLFVGAVAG